MDCRCPVLQGGLSHSTSQHFRSRQSTVPHLTAGSRPEFCRINEQLEEEEICSLLQLLINWWTAEQLHQDLVIGIKVQNPLDARHTRPAMPMDSPAFWCRLQGEPPIFRYQTHSKLICTVPRTVTMKRGASHCRGKKGALCAFFGIWGYCSRFFFTDVYHMLSLCHWKME